MVELELILFIGNSKQKGKFMKRFFFVLLFSYSFFVNTVAANSPTPAASAVAASKPAASTSNFAFIIKVSDDKKSIVVDVPNKVKGFEYSVNKDIQDQIGQGLILSQGDKVTLEVDEKGTVTSIKPDKTIQISGQSRLLYLLISAALLLIFSSIALGLAGGGNILSLIVGEDNRYSDSKFQIALWFFIVITTYLAVVILRYRIAGGEYLLVNIPQNLLLLSGMSVLTYSGAKAITSSKNNPEDLKNAVVAAADEKAANEKAAKSVTLNVNVTADKDAAKAAHSDAKIKPDAAKAAHSDAKIKADADYNPGKPNFFKDLLNNNLGQVDFGDYQMLVVTILAAGVYLLQIYHFMGHVDLLRVVTLPDVDTTILSVVGLGQGAYLAKKYGGDAGKQPEKPSEK